MSREKPRPVSTAVLSRLLESAMGKRAFQRSQRQKPQTSSERAADAIAGRGNTLRPVYILQKVVRRTPVPFQPNPNDPKHLLYYVKEQLECGHEMKF